MSASSPQEVTIEVCVGSVDDALAAAAGGADRLELCSALELGGLTPSLGLLEDVLQATDLPIVTMIRPRAGGFAYSDREFATMLHEARHAVGAGAAGIVFGCLQADASVDAGRVAQLVQAAEGRQTVFHKAFDCVSDQAAALEVLIQQQVTRVLTSGGCASAIEGKEQLRGLAAQAIDRIEILPGGGVAADHAAELITHTGLSQLHLGAATGGVDPSVTQGQSIALNDLKRLSQGEHRKVDETKVRAARDSTG